MSRTLKNDLSGVLLYVVFTTIKKKNHRKSITATEWRMDWREREQMTGAVDSGDTAAAQARGEGGFSRVVW